MAREKSDVAALLLSIIIPGSGHMYKGQTNVGIVWLMFVIAGYGLFLFPGLLLHMACIVHATITTPTDEETPAEKPDGPLKLQKR